MSYNTTPNFIDHINHNRSDNSIKNLRSVTHEENLKNMPKKKNNKSGITGVCFEKETGKWRSHITHKGKSIKLGRFENKKDAEMVRLKAELEYGFHENHGRG